MKKFLLILSLFLVFTVSYSFSEEIESEVMSVNPEQEFFIIKAGADEGIKMGDGLIVHRDLAKIAEAYVVEVRKNISAAEVLNVNQGGKIQEGDKIAIYKEKPKKIYRKEGTGDWARLGPESERVAAEERYESTPRSMVHRYREKPKKIYRKEETGEWTRLGPKSERVTVKERYPRSMVHQEGGTVKVIIGRDTETVFSYASLILREDGYLITSSNRGIGALLAYKPVPLSLADELWADATAKIDHRLTLSVNIAGDKNSTKLTMSAFKEHAQKEKHIKIPVAKNSKYYNTLADMAAEIKERSEH